MEDRDVQTETLQKTAELKGGWPEDERYRRILRQTGTLAFIYYPLECRYEVYPPFEEKFDGQYDGRDLPFQILDNGIVHEEDIPLLMRFYMEVKENSPVCDHMVTLRLKDKYGVFLWSRLTASVLSNADGTIKEITGAIVNVDGEVRLYDSLDVEMEYDDVTGIYNRQAFLNRTKLLLDSQTNCPHHILRLDIDNFKVVNDLFGMAEGDRLLYFMGQMLQRKVRGEETYARMRDDVFCMCLSRSEDETLDVVREMDAELRAYALVFKLVLSVGIYTVGLYDGAPVNLLCDRANLAQKTVKGNYIRRYAFYTPRMSDALMYEQRIIGETFQALEEGHFVVFLQPQCDMESENIVGAEALVRWIHPTKGLISPSQFIMLFEKNGFIIQVDEFVWEAVCRLLRQWTDQGLTPPPISVNVSRMHLYDLDFCDKLIGLMKKYSLSPGAIKLELTESAYAENPQLLLDIMAKLRAHGFLFMMDDFGSGFSSLNMLQNTPVDVLKIDLTFLKESKDLDTGKVILETTISMAHRLGISVIAEGVETADQVAFLRATSCRLAQGYYYSRPITTQEFEERYLRR